jgi:S-adenosyl methyltransferase
LAAERGNEPAERPAPAGIDVSKPNIARVYDALLGGKDNFTADREFIEMAMRQTTPDAPLAARANRNAGELAVAVCCQGFCGSAWRG